MEEIIISLMAGQLTVLIVLCHVYLTIKIVKEWRDG